MSISELNIPPFRPSRLLSGSHTQTLVPYFIKEPDLPYRAVEHHAELADGDKIVLHDDSPEGWTVGDPCVMMIHGLAGCHRSPYVERLTAKCNQIGIRTFRMDMRGCGAGMKFSRWPSNAGRSADVAAAIQKIAEITSRSPLTIVGFSLGGNQILKCVGEVDEHDLTTVTSAVAISPPADLEACSIKLMQPSNWMYDRYFRNILYQQVAMREALNPNVEKINWPRKPRGLKEFDTFYTAPLGGFESVEDYYQKASSLPLWKNINVPTLILTSKDDPLIPIESMIDAPRSKHVQFHSTERGGHLGFYGKHDHDQDARWMDWRLVDWIKSVHSM